MADTDSKKLRMLPCCSVSSSLPGRPRARQDKTMYSSHIWEDIPLLQLQPLSAFGRI